MLRIYGCNDVSVNSMRKLSQAKILTVIFTSCAERMYSRFSSGGGSGINGGIADLFGAITDFFSSDDGSGWFTVGE